MPIAFTVFFWGFAMASSGYDIESIVTVAKDSNNLDPVQRDKTCKYLVEQLDRHINYERHLSTYVSYKSLLLLYRYTNKVHISLV